MAWLNGVLLHTLFTAYVLLVFSDNCSVLSWGTVYRICCYIKPPFIIIVTIIIITIIIIIIIILVQCCIVLLYL